MAEVTEVGALQSSRLIPLELQLVHSLVALGYNQQDDVAKNKDFQLRKPGLNFKEPSSSRLFTILHFLALRLDLQGLPAVPKSWGTKERSLIYKILKPFCDNLIMEGKLRNVPDYPMLLTARGVRVVEFVVELCAYVKDNLMKQRLRSRQENRAGLRFNDSILASPGAPRAGEGAEALLLSTASQLSEAEAALVTVSEWQTRDASNYDAAKEKLTIKHTEIMRERAEAGAQQAARLEEGGTLDCVKLLEDAIRCASKLAAQRSAMEAFKRTSTLASALVAEHTNDLKVPRDAIQRLQELAKHKRVSDRVLAELRSVAQTDLNHPLHHAMETPASAEGGDNGSGSSSKGQQSSEEEKMRWGGADSAESFLVPGSHLAQRAAAAKAYTAHLGKIKAACTQTQAQVARLEAHHISLDAHVQRMFEERVEQGVYPDETTEFTAFLELYDRVVNWDPPAPSNVEPSISPWTHWDDFYRQQ